MKVIEEKINYYLSQARIYGYEIPTDESHQDQSVENK